MPDQQRSLSVAIIGGGMFFDDIIGQSFKDLMHGGMAGALTSIGMSHLAPAVADIEIKVTAVGTRSESSGTAGRIVDWFIETRAAMNIDVVIVGRDRRAAIGRRSRLGVSRATNRSGL